MRKHVVDVRGDASPFLLGASFAFTLEFQRRAQLFRTLLRSEQASRSHAVPEVTPRAANAALHHSTPAPGFDTLNPWQGGLILAGYIALAVLGTFLSVRRDVT